MDHVGDFSLICRDWEVLARNESLNRLSERIPLRFCVTAVLRRLRG